MEADGWRGRLTPRQTHVLTVLDEVKPGIGHWYAESLFFDLNHLGPDTAVEVTVAEVGLLAATLFFPF